MQHLFDNDHEPEVKVPYYGHIDQGDTFLDYPRSQGWDTDWIVNWQLAQNGKSALEAHAFLQAWLFFGLLESVMDLPVSVADFVYEDERGNQMITTARLSDYYMRWKNRDYTIGPEPRQVILNKTMPYMKEANKIVLALWRRFGNRPRPVSDLSAPALSPELLLSLQLIGLALTTARGNIHGKQSGTVEDRISFDYFWGHSQPMNIHMLDLGWCSSVVAAFANKPLDVQCYAATLSAPQVKKNHSLCTARRCLGNQVDEENYEVKHVLEGCACDVVEAKVDEIVSIIKRGGIPLLPFASDTVINVDNEGNVNSLNAIEYQPTMPYVAINHV